jgi:hypothetical protein
MAKIKQALKKGGKGLKDPPTSFFSVQQEQKEKEKKKQVMLNLSS